jgi:hypothetical protein
LLPTQKFGPPSPAVSAKLPVITRARTITGAKTSASPSPSASNTFPAGIGRGRAITAVRAAGGSTITVFGRRKNSRARAAPAPATRGALPRASPDASSQVASANRKMPGPDFSMRPS